MRHASLLATAALSLTFSATAQAGTRLPGSLVALGQSVRTIGEADPSARVQFQLVLKLRNRELLEQRLARREVLSAEALAADHLPLAADIAGVAAWLTSEDLTVDGVDPSGTAIYASGTAARVARALGTHFSAIASEGSAYVAADAAPSVPDAIAPLVLAINGLQPHLHAHKMLHRNAAAGGGVLLPVNFRHAYGAVAEGSGGNAAVTAIVIDTLPLQSDLTRFWQQASVAGSLSKVTFINVLGIFPLPADTDEATLDAETVTGIAPAAPVRVYAAGALTFSALDAAFQRVIADMKARIKIRQVTISLGACEANVSQGQADTDDQYFALMSSLGASVFVSSGDEGSASCGGSQNIPEFYATSPHVTAVGGTSLNMTRNTVTSETAWSGSTGGVSTLFTTGPAWQEAVNESTARTSPDIAADANPNTGEMIILNGQAAEYGGTSLSAPLCAALFSLINEKRAVAGKSPLGLLGPLIYPYVTTAKFRDITTGSAGAYSAHIGYDWVTGLGTPNVSQLAPALLALP